MPSPTQWTVQQLMIAVRAKPSRPARFNPRPPGVIRKGSATDAVFQLLKENPRVGYTHGQIVQATGRSRKAVDWGLLFLRRSKLIECFGDARNSRYWVYRLKGKPSRTLRWKK